MIGVGRWLFKSGAQFSVAYSGFLSQNTGYINSILGCVVLSVALESVLWRADQMAQPAGAVLPSGYAALDGVLPGAGWPRQGLTELLCDPPLSAELRLLAPVLARHTQSGGEVLLLAPPQAPSAAAWTGWGIDPTRLVWVPTQGALDSVWALGECLRARLPLVLLAWLPEVSPLTLRRLQVLAAGALAPCFLVRPAVAASGASPAPLRLRLGAETGGRLRVQVLKRRGVPVSEPLWLDAPPPNLAPLWAGRRQIGQRQSVPMHTPIQTPEASHVVAGSAARKAERA